MLKPAIIVINFCWTQHTFLVSGDFQRKIT